MEGSPWYLLLFILVPLTPSGFNITGEVYTVADVTVLFEWSEPQGSGPEAVVDNYIIVITPPPLSPAQVSVVPNYPQALNVTLAYNTSYSATITAENCAGRGVTFAYPQVIEYGMYIKY